MSTTREQTPNPPGTPKPDAEAVKQQATEAVQGVKEQVQESTGQAADQVKQFASAQVGTQKDRVTQSLGSVTDALRQASGQLRDGKQGAFFAQYADTAADRVEQLTNHLDERDINELMMDVESYACRQPALFLGGAFVLGIVAARYLKSSSQRANSGGSSGAGFEGGDTNRPMNRSFDERGVGMRDAGYRESLRRGSVPHQSAVPSTPPAPRMSPAPGTLPPAPGGATASSGTTYTGQIPAGPNAMTGQATAGQASTTNTQGSTGTVRSMETD